MKAENSSLASTPRGEGCSYSGRSTSGSKQQCVCVCVRFQMMCSLNLVAVPPLAQVEKQPPGAAKERVEFMELKPKLG